MVSQIHNDSINVASAAAVQIGNSILTHPAAINTGIEIIGGYIDPNPPTTLPGAFGAGLKRVEDGIRR